MNTPDLGHLAAGYQTAQSQGNGGGMTLAIVVVIGLIALMTGLSRHIRTLWQLASTFIEPMIAAMKALALVAFVIIIVVAGLVWTADDGTSAASPPVVTDQVD
ncbi:hypothetical protein [Pseudofrankia sp. BMG5.37]|uniref:hypothetical protein n=1 Tax=Pseudofrankia sp. BMG5.37 TaxID=3050035 RepID=UPI002893F4EC|nr:hypothetical protein [Pseudofrankia sp. BMG5.37]MDT3438857.1 hypothetical protein [Pseudofrankia sp. BMG5.37]